MNKQTVDPKLVEEVIKRCLDTSEGKQKLARSLAGPLRKRIDYQSIGRKTFMVDSLPPIVTCPECESEFTEEHPNNGCSLGHVYNIMET